MYDFAPMPAVIWFIQEQRYTILCGAASALFVQHWEFAHSRIYTDINPANRNAKRAPSGARLLYTLNDSPIYDLPVKTLFFRIVPAKIKHKHWPIERLPDVPEKPLMGIIVQ